MNPMNPISPKVPLPQEHYRRRNLIPFGTALLLVTAGLLGCLAIYSARAYGDAPMVFVIRQLFWLIPGILIFLLASAIPFRFYRKAAAALLGLSVAALAAILFQGTPVNGMRGWFDLGWIKLQPSEFAKPFLLLYLCVQCGIGKNTGAGQWFRLILPGLLLTALVMAEPDYGGGLIFFLIFLLVAILNGARFSYLLAAGTAMLTATIGFLLKNHYAMVRIMDFLNPENEKAWHIHQFQYAMAHGGWTGAERGSALWSGTFLPLPHTDSLFASIVESTGFLGGVLLIGGFLAVGIAFCLLSWKVRTENPDRRFFIFSAGTICLIQALIHISVNCVLIPPTGITLPILSYGGSSLLAVMLTFGIAFSAARPDELEPIGSVPQTTGGQLHTDPAKLPPR